MDNVAAGQGAFRLGALTAAEIERLDNVYWGNRRHWDQGTVPNSELLYLQIFDRAVERSGIKVPPLFPVGSAANAGLLYVLFRLAWDFPGGHWLELGAGQSTLLLDALARAGRVASALTIEHHAGWAERLQRQVAHPVRHAPLRQASSFGVTAPTYTVSLDQRFDTILVDGPIGMSEHSRWGALELLCEHLAGDFVVVFDDAERPGERATIAKFLEFYPAAKHVLIHAMKSQCLVFTEKYQGVASYS
jgi:predicted O-methyltransferase YrrM